MNNEELNVLPIEDVEVETLPVKSGKAKVTKNIVIGTLGVILIAGAVYFVGKQIKKHNAKKASNNTESVEENKSEE